MAVAVVVLEGEEEGEVDDSESVEPPLNDKDSYAEGVYEDEASDDKSEDLAYYQAPGTKGFSWASTSSWGSIKTLHSGF